MKACNVFRMSRMALFTLAALLGILCTTPLTATSQGLTVKTISAPVNVLSISDVDFISAATTQWLFSVDIDAGGRSIYAVMTIDLSYTLATGSTRSNVFHLVTKTFPVQGSRTITNLDIGKTKAVKDSTHHWDATAKQELEDIALPSGQLPAGTYTFNVAVTEVPSGTSATAGDAFNITLTNPSTVELLFPVDADQSVSTLPLFQWLFDGTQSHIAVYQKLTGQTSLEEAAQGVPMVSVDVAGSSYQYPASGVRPLVGGSTYVWYVEGHIKAAGGRDKIVRSPLRSFTVAAGPGTTSSLLDELERSLDPKYKSLFDQLRESGCVVSGSARLNGGSVSSSDLLQILKYLRTNPDAVQTVGVDE